MRVRKMSGKKAIVVTAPGSGIGQAIVQHLARKGHHILGMGRESSQVFCESLQARGLDNVTFIRAEDLTDEQTVVKAFQDVKKVTSRIDGLVHCVGGSLMSKELVDLSLEEFRRVLDVNLTSSFLVAREAMKWMRHNGGGNIILFGSTTGFEPTAKKGAYAVAKAGVHMLVASLALESARHGIAVNGIAPGYVLTPRHVRELEMLSRRQNISLDVLKQQIASKNPWARILEPEELNSIVDMLLETRQIHGQVIRVDYGQVLTI